MKRNAMKGAALLVALSLAAVPQMALAEETPAPEATPVPISEEVAPIAELPAVDGEGAPTAPRAAPKTNTFAFGQSMQIRVNADAEPNSSLANFRWSVGQLTVQAPPDTNETVTVPVPEQGIATRYLNSLGRPTVTDGVAQLEVPVSDGFGLSRTVSLAPGDFQPPVSLTAEFTLDGEPITAKDLVGKSGVVTAKYTLRNLTATPTEVTVKDLAGNDVVKTVNAETPFIGIAQTLLPQRYTGLNTGSGQFGADGRANNQVQWIALPFAPLSRNSSASFGWAANVTDAVIPSMLIQLAPVYIPPDADPATAEEAAAQAIGSLPVDLSPAAAQISGGVASLLAGLNGLSEQAAASGDPLETVQDALNSFFQQFGTNIQNIANLLDPANTEGVTALVTNLSGVLAQVNAALATLQTELSPERLGQLQSIADNWGTVVDAIRVLQQALPYLITTVDSGLPIDCSVPDPAQAAAQGKIGVGQLNRLIIGGSYQGHVGRQSQLPQTANLNDSFTFGAGVSAGAAIWREDETGVVRWQTGGLPSQSTACQVAVAAANLAISTQVPEGLADQLRRLQPILDQAVQSPALDPANVDQVQSALQFLATNLSGIVTTLIPLTNLLATQLASLGNSLALLNQQVSVVAQGLQATNVDLPALDAVVAQLVGQVLASPNGQQITGGLGQIQTGLNSAVQELTTFIGAAIVQARGLAGSADEAVVNVRASIAGLLQAASASPLVYGEPDPNAPPDTVLAGAYEFRIDAADSNIPNTLPRILLGLVALIAAGLLGFFIKKRNHDAVLAGVPAGAGVGAAAAPDADMSATQQIPVAPVANPSWDGVPDAQRPPLSDEELFRQVGITPPVKPPAAPAAPDDPGPLDPPTDEPRP
jgi:hypothetical protein